MYDLTVDPVQRHHVSLASGRPVRAPLRKMMIFHIARELGGYLINRHPTPGKPGQKGNWRWPIWMVTHFSSVISSIDQRPPSRPMPLSLIPPKGACGSS